MALTLGDNFSYQGAKPLDARLKYDTLAAMKAVADATMYDGCMAYCSATDKTYQWKSSNTVDETLGKWREFSSGGGGGTDYTAGDGIDITNDVISTKQSEEGDIDEIVDVYPQAGNLVSIVNAFNKGDIYSTEEKMIGQWVDGKPLYQKTIVHTLTSNIENVNYDIPANLSDIETVACVSGIIYEANSTNISIPLVSSPSSSNLGIISIGVISASAIQIRLPKQNLNSGTKLLITVQYTKTTDSAISIGEETEYSTTEKVVGTWIDGKPLYQCTFEVNNPSTDWSEIILANKSVSYVHKVGAEFYRGGIFTEFFNSTSDFVSCAVFAGSNLACRIKQAGNSGITKAIFTIQYTKTTT